MKRYLGTEKEINRKDFLQAIHQKGIASFCCTDPRVVECVLEQANLSQEYALIEATSNQVNQTGGYVGMTPKQFVQNTRNIATQISFDSHKLILGGDHIGPLPWRNLPAREAMRNAETLITECVKAGYTKIHIDTSMPLGDDPAVISPELKVERCVHLYQIAMAAYEELVSRKKNQPKPMFVIGTDVPFAGGLLMLNSITSPDALQHTLDLYQNAFAKAGCLDAFENIIAIVIELELDFNETGTYLHEAVERLKPIMQHFPNLVLEGHSTDYQSKQTLHLMKEDGIRIVKVGPALTYAHREALISLSQMEQERIPESKQANYPWVLESAMIENPIYWKDWYTGNEAELHQLRMHSKLDRGRYYMALPMVRNAEKELIGNLESMGIEPNKLIQDSINEVVRTYMEA
jgi:D-tagatose-1,6-bisphosphate aldolase subunit GatZ/KbaZ